MKPPQMLAVYINTITTTEDTLDDNSLRQQIRREMSCHLHTLLFSETLRFKYPITLIIRLGKSTALCKVPAFIFAALKTWESCNISFLTLHVGLLSY